MTTESTEVPQGVMKILRKRAEEAAQRKALANRFTEGPGRGELEAAELRRLAAEWRSGLNAMRMA